MFYWFFFFLERKREEGRQIEIGRETATSVWVLPWPGIEPTLFRCIGWCFNQWSHPAMALQCCFLMGYNSKPKKAFPILRSHLHSLSALPACNNTQTWLLCQDHLAQVSLGKSTWKTQSSKVRSGIHVKMEMVSHPVPSLGELGWGSGRVEMQWRTRQNTDPREISFGPNVHVLWRLLQ